MASSGGDMLRRGGAAERFFSGADQTKPQATRIGTFRSGEKKTPRAVVLRRAVHGLPAGRYEAGPTATDTTSTASAVTCYGNGGRRTREE